MRFWTDLRVSCSDLIIDSYLVGMTISHEVEVMDGTGTLRGVEEGKSVSRPALSEAQEEQHHGQPES